jgi:hypothetical protein
MHLIDSLSRDTLIGIIGLLIGGISIILAFFFYFKSKKKIQIKFLTKDLNLLSNGIKKNEEIKFLFKNKEVDTLTISKIVIWNTGTETINKEDIPDKAPLVVLTTDKIIFYDVQLLDVSDRTNNVSIESDFEKTAIKINFDYIDSNQGFILKITHSGIQPSMFFVAGKIKGNGIIEQFVEPTYGNDKLGSMIFSSFPFSILPHKWKIRTLYGINLVVGMSIISIGIFQLIKTGTEDGSLLVFIGSLLCVLVIWMLSRKSIPKNFRDHLQF